MRVALLVPFVGFALLLLIGFIRDLAFYRAHAWDFEKDNPEAWVYPQDEDDPTPFSNRDKVLIIQLFMLLVTTIICLGIAFS